MADTVTVTFRYKSEMLIIVNPGNNAKKKLQISTKISIVLNFFPHIVGPSGIPAHAPASGREPSPASRK
jgi:hypothetical protein